MGQVITIEAARERARSKMTWKIPASELAVSENTERLEELTELLEGFEIVKRLYERGVITQIVLLAHGQGAAESGETEDIDFVAGSDMDEVAARELAFGFAVDPERFTE